MINQNIWTVREQCRVIHWGAVGEHYKNASLRINASQALGSPLDGFAVNVLFAEGRERHSPQSFE